MERELFDGKFAFSGRFGTPPNATTAPAVVFAHGGGETYTAFESEARELNERGIATLLVDLPVARNRPLLSEPDALVESTRSAVATIEAAAAFLRERPEVDADHIAYVGISYGAWIGVLFAATQPAIDAYVLIATPPRLSELLTADEAFASLRIGIDDDGLAACANALRAIDALEHAPALRGRRLLLQWAANDEVISLAAADAFREASGAAARSAVYDSDHAHIGVHAGARLDRANWLATMWQLPERPSR